MTHHVRKCSPSGAWHTVFAGTLAQCEAYLLTMQGWGRVA